MRTTKQEKDKYPNSYGYGSVEQLQNDPNNKLTHWVSFIDHDGDLRFVPCTEMYFHKHRNENRNEKRRNDTYRKNCPISTDSLLDDYEFEFADLSYEEDREREQEQEVENYILNLISEFSEKDQLILKLFNDGHTDASIAAIINKARSTVQEKRVKLVNELKEKLKKFQ